MVLPLATRHWCANPRGCKRHTTWRSGKKCHGFTGFSTNDARLEQRNKKETRATVMLGTDRGDVSVESMWVKSIWALCRSPKQCGKASFWHHERFPALGRPEGYLRSVRISPDTTKITASQIKTKDGMRQSVIFEAGHCVQHIVTIIHHERRPSRKRFEQSVVVESKEVRFVLAPWSISFSSVVEKRPKNMTICALHARPAGDSPVCANQRVRLAPEKGLGMPSPRPNDAISYTLHNQSVLRLASRFGSLVFACLLTWRPGRDVPIQDSTHFSHSAALKELGGGFRTLPVGFPLPTIFWSPLFMLFCPLILDHGVCLIISISGPKKSCFVNLAQYFFLPLSSICDNQVQPSSDESPCCTIPIRSWVSQTLVFWICTILPRCHQVGFASLTIKIPSHFESNSWISSFRTTIVNRSALFSTEALAPVTQKY